MKKILPLLLAILITGPALSQKMVIGSKVPDLKTVEWLTTAPPPLDGSEARPMLIEFYDPGNSTVNRLFPRLRDIKAKYGNNSSLLIILLTRQSGPIIQQLVQDHGNDYYIGSDPDGKTYQNFNVRFLPYTILVDSKNQLHWQGNLSNITDHALTSIR